jgi:hypothetical protein
MWRYITAIFGLLCIAQVGLLVFSHPPSPATHQQQVQRASLIGSIIGEPILPEHANVDADGASRIHRQFGSNNKRNHINSNINSDGVDNVPVAFIDFDNPSNVNTLVGRILPPIMPQPDLARVFPKQQRDINTQQQRTHNVEELLEVSHRIAAHHICH